MVGALVLDLLTIMAVCHRCFSSASSDARRHPCNEDPAVQKYLLGARSKVRTMLQSFVIRHEHLVELDVRVLDCWLQRLVLVCAQLQATCATFDKEALDGTVFSQVAGPDQNVV